MTSWSSLGQGDVLTNKELCARFKCGARGGMRFSKSTNSLVLILDHTKNLYRDQWIDEGRLDYVGTGRVGEQKLKRANERLAKSKNQGITVHLFEVFERGKYFYQGEVILAGAPYQEWQPDVNGKSRQVWVFPLQLVHGPRIGPEEYLNKEEEKEKQQARAIQDTNELFLKASESPGFPPRVQVTTQQYKRNQYLAEYVKRQANGKCDLCKNPAPFYDTEGNPFLEIHHIKWLSKGGRDAINNTVALCPNCHRKMHVRNEKEDLKKLKKMAQERKIKI